MPDREENQIHGPHSGPVTLACGRGTTIFGAGGRRPGLVSWSGVSRTQPVFASEWIPISLATYVQREDPVLTSSAAAGGRRGRGRGPSSGPEGGRPPPRSARSTRLRCSVRTGCALGFAGSETVRPRLSSTHVETSAQLGSRPSPRGFVSVTDAAPGTREISSLREEEQKNAHVGEQSVGCH